ncbi:MAG: NAD(P)H-hydrate dehydratase [Lentisphaerales bacterium]|nr:NAD(P)H-hydrate dehydratase [Lentisphaerales bacterium]
MKIVTAEVMRGIDKETIEKGYVSGVVLMERAGVGAAKEILNFAAGLHEKFRKQFVILCGKGNNGGDGYVIAKVLFEKGYDVKVLATTSLSDLVGDALYHAKLLPTEVMLEEFTEETSFESGQILVDCLLGTGLSKSLREPYLKLVSKINKSGLPVVSVDIASGLNGTTGNICGDAVVADLTVAIGLPKIGYFSSGGAACTGVLKCIDIGFPKIIVDHFVAEGQIISSEDISGLFVRRSHSVHKYRCGNVAVIGGSKKYMGAVKLASAAAARAGAGMVSCFYPGSGEAPKLDSIISVGIEPCVDGNFHETAAEAIRESLAKVNTVVFGPGLIASASAKEMLAVMLRTDCRIVLDAGALSLVADLHKLISASENDIVLTPHSGEIQRLGKILGLSGSDFEVAAEIVQRMGVFIVLKGQFSRIFKPDGTYVINSSGCSKLATAGSGDVLAGVIGAFSAEFNDFYKSVGAAVFVHGLAGDMTDKGIRGTVADDLVETLPEVLKSLSPYA